MDMITIRIHKVKHSKQFITRTKSRYNLKEIACCKCNKNLENEEYSYRSIAYSESCFYCQECYEKLYIDINDEGYNENYWVYDKERDIWILEKLD